MNSITVTGYYDFKVYGFRRTFLQRPFSCVIKSQVLNIHEVCVNSPSGQITKLNLAKESGPESWRAEFQPEESGVHFFKIYSDTSRRELFSSFEAEIIDLSELKITLDDQVAFVGRLFKLYVEFPSNDEVDMNTYIEQQEKNLTTSVKNLSDSEDQSKLEINFTPETESTCFVELEFYSKISNEIIFSQNFSIVVRPVDFRLIPFPLFPFAVNTVAKFKIECLREKVGSLKVFVKSIGSSRLIECSVIANRELPGLFEVSFFPELVERHILEIYFDNELVNKNQTIKIDLFDASKIKASLPGILKLGEINTFIVDTTGAGEGNLEVVIKDGFDTLKAQLLKREKRKFVIGFVSEKNTKHDIHVIFNEMPIKDSPFSLAPDFSLKQNTQNMPVPNTDIEPDEKLPSIYTIVEGGPLEGIQCGEKMWILLDAKTPPYYDVQFSVLDQIGLRVKHTKTQRDDGTWRIEFIPTSTGWHQIKRILLNDSFGGDIGLENKKSHLLHRANVLSYGEPRVLYGYKFYDANKSVQLVFDAVGFNVNDIVTEVKGPDGKSVNDFECKYLTDYLALKFLPRKNGNYGVEFNDRVSQSLLALSPYKIAVDEQRKEVIKSSGIYDVTRIIIAENYLLADYQLSEFSVNILDSYGMPIQNCFFLNTENDLVIEFITRNEGFHKIFFYVNEILVDDNPFLVYVNGDSNAKNLVPEGGFLLTTPSYQNLSPLNDSSDFSGSSSSDSQILLRDCLNQPLVSYNGIFCCKLGQSFHYVLNQINIQGLCVYDPLNRLIPYTVGEDSHGNKSLIIQPTVEGTHKFYGLIEGRDFEAQLFVLENPGYEELFEMDNFNQNTNIIEQPFKIVLKEETIEIDAYDPLGERVDVRYDNENLATIVPHTTGYFKIYVSDYYGPIMGSPFFVLINNFPQVDEHEEKKVECVESSGIRDSIKNEETTFVIRHKNLELEVFVKNPNNEIVTIRKKRTSKGFLQVFYTPDSIGLYEISIIKNGQHVLGSPINTYVSDPLKVKIVDFKEESKVGELCKFVIDTMEAGEGFIRVSIKDSNQNDVLPEIVELDDRRYSVQFLAKTIGVYEFALTFNKYHVDKSPFRILITEGKRSSDLTGEDPYNNEAKFDATPSTPDYEIKNRSGIKFNSTLNKIMEETILDTENEIKDVLSTSAAMSKNFNSPTITDTSESDSSGETLKGEAYLENVEQLGDGGSHLLLYLDGNNSQLIKSKNPEKLKGKYKYQLKRISKLGNLANSGEVIGDGQKSKKLVKKSGPLKASSNESEEEIRVRNKLSKTGFTPKSDEKIKKELSSFNDKRKLFESHSKSPEQSSIKGKKSPPFSSGPAAGTTKQLPEESEADKAFKKVVKKIGKEDAPETPKTLDQRSSSYLTSDKLKKTNPKSLSPTKSTSSSNSVSSLISKLNKNRGDVSEPADVASVGNAAESKKNQPHLPDASTMKKTLREKLLGSEKASHKLSAGDSGEEEEEEEEEIVVSKEKTTTKLTRDKHKKIDNQTTQIIDERYVMTPDKKILVQRAVEVVASDSGSDDSAEVAQISSQKQEKLVGMEEKEKSFVNNLVRITTNKSGSNKPTSRETFVEKRRVNPVLLAHAEQPGEKVVEKMKSEETVEYEYEQVIEQPEPIKEEKSADSKLKFAPRSRSEIESTKVENVTTKSTKKKSRHRYETVEVIEKGGLKKADTEVRTYLSEDEEDKITEMLEKKKDTDEYSYLKARSKRLNETAGDLVDEETSHLGVSGQMVVNDFDLGLSRNLKVTASSDIERRLDDPGMFYGGSDEQGDELSDYYKLNKPDEGETGVEEEDDEEVESPSSSFSNRVKLNPVDVKELGYGERFKPTDKTVVVRNNLEKDSQSSILENNDSFEVDVLDDDNDTVGFKPIDRRFGARRSPSAVDLLKAKFEQSASNLNNISPRDSLRTRSEEPNRVKPTPSKLDKSKFEVYDKPDETVKVYTPRNSFSSGSPTELKRSSSELATGRKTPPSDRQQYQESMAVKDLLNKYERRSPTNTTSPKSGKISPTKKDAILLINQLKDDNAAANDIRKKLNEQVKSILEKPSGGTETEYDQLTRKSSKSPLFSEGSSKPIKKLDKSFLSQYESNKQDATSPTSPDKPYRSKKSEELSFLDRSRLKPVENPVSSSLDRSLGGGDVGGGDGGGGGGDRKFPKFHKIDPEQRIKEQQELTEQILQDESKIKRLAERFQDKNKDGSKNLENINNSPDRPSRLRKSPTNILKGEPIDLYGRPRQTSLLGGDKDEQDSNNQNRLERRSQSSQPDSPTDGNNIKKLSQKLFDKFDNQPNDISNLSRQKKGQDRDYSEPKTSGGLKNLLDRFEPVQTTKSISNRQPALEVDTDEEDIYKDEGIQVVEIQVPKTQLDERIEKNRRDIQNIINNINKPNVELNDPRSSSTISNNEISRTFKDYDGRPKDVLRSQPHSENQMQSSDRNGRSPNDLDKILKTLAGEGRRRSPRLSEMESILKDYGSEFERVNRPAGDKNLRSPLESYLKDLGIKQAGEANRRSPQPSDLDKVLKEYSTTSRESKNINSPHSSELENVLKDYRKKFEDKIRDYDNPDPKLKDLKTFRDDGGQLSATVYIPETFSSNDGSSRSGRGQNSSILEASDDVAVLPKLKKKIDYDGEYAPIKFTDRQASIGSESRVYPHLGSRELVDATVRDEKAGSARPTVSPRSNSESAKYRMDERKESAIEVQLEVEYKDPLQFSVRKTDDGEPVNFKRLYKQNPDKQLINFNYESIVDFTVDVSKTKKYSISTGRYDSGSEDDENLYAEIEITVIGDYLFQIISKKDNISIPIKVFPKSNNTYRIQFQPSCTSGYVLQAKSDRRTSGFSARQGSRVSVGPLKCSFNNPKNLAVTDLIANDQVLSFTVNTKSAGSGILNCYVYYSDGRRAKIEESKQIGQYLHSFKIAVDKEKSGTLNLFLAHEST